MIWVSPAENQHIFRKQKMQDINPCPHGSCVPEGALYSLWYFDYFKKKKLFLIAAFIRLTFKDTVSFMNCRFMYAFLGLGITLCVITCTGHVAAETANGCCLYLVSFFLNQLNWNWWSYFHHPLYVLHILGFWSESLFCYWWSDYIFHCNINYLSNLFH